jgi:hypothetical protein
MKLQFLVFMLIALAFNHYNTAFANPVALSPTSRNLAVSAPTNAFSPRIAHFGLDKPSTTSNNNSTQANAEGQSPPAAKDNHTLLKVALCFGFAVLLLIGAGIAYCYCRYQKTVMLGPAGIAAKGIKAFL